MEFSKSLSENVERLKKVLQADKNFDIVYRTFDIAGKKAALFFVDGFTKDEVLLKIIDAKQKKFKVIYKRDYGKGYLLHHSISVM